MRSNVLRAGIAAGLLIAAFLTAPPAVAVDTDIAISTTAIDFGTVNLGQTATVSVTLTNTGADPFGPVNMFGGAPPTTEFNASQNCQATTLPAGGSCMINYSFTPGSGGPFTDSSNFTVSETTNQSDGEDFAVALKGCGAGGACDPNATTTTAPTTTTVTTVATPAPTQPPSAGQPAPAGNSPGAMPTTPTSVAVAAAKLEATVEREKAAPGQTQKATVRGFKAGESVTATEQPDRRAIGTEAANSDGEVTFTWIISTDDTLGSHEFIATGVESGPVSARYTVVATEAEAASDDDSGLSPWLIALIVILVLGAIAAAVAYAFRRGRSGRGPGEGSAAPPDPPGPEEPTAPVPQV